MFGFSAINASFANYVGDLVVVLILIIAAFLGAKKGFVGLVVGLLGGIVVMAAATLLCAPVANVIGDGFGLRENVENFVSGKFDFSGDIFSKPIKDVTAEEIATAIETLKVPAFLAKALSNLIASKIAESGVGADVSVQSVIVGGISNAALTAIAWIGLFIIFSIIMMIIKKFVKGFNQIPIIGPINRLLGLVGYVLIWAAIICVVMYFTVLLSASLPAQAMEYIDNSVILKWVYNYNPVARVLTMIFTK
ncbi:MAG: CvpA family protein [Clostridia bacterium]|nr:CvpA family protein [Clostridia bacterium]